MNTLQGRISGIQRQAVEGGGTRTTFRLHSTDARETQVETRLDLAHREGDMVQVSGEVNSDLVLIAVSIAPVSVPPAVPRKFPWRLVRAVFLLLILFFALKSCMSSGSTLTVTATHCGVPAPNETISLMAKSNGPPTPVTHANSKWVFRGLAKGTYAILGPDNKLLESVQVDGKTDPLPIEVNLTRPIYCVQMLDPLKVRPHP